jgi:hypothetical protein
MRLGGSLFLPFPVRVDGREIFFKNKVAICMPIAELTEFMKRLAMLLMGCRNFGGVPYSSY